MPTSKVSKRAQMLKKAPIRTVKWTVWLGRDDDVYDELDSLITEYNTLVKDEPEPPAEAVALRPRISELSTLVALESKLEGRFRKETSLMRWEEFLADFPPRVLKGWKAPEDDPDAQPELEFPDSVLGFDASLAYPAAVRKYMVDPMDDDEWKSFTAHLTDEDWDRLGTQIVRLNRRAVDVPKLPSGFLGTTRLSSD